MTTEISGIVEDAGGSAIQGARVFIVRESDDTVVATDTTDSLGEYQVVGLSDFETYFVVAQYDDGSTKYNGTSYPVVTPFTGTGPIDDFEDADIVEYSGEKVSFDIINSPVYDGTNALGMTNDDGGAHLITSQSGLPRYPEEGDTFSFRTYLEPDAQTAGFLFGVQDSDNYYRARILDSTFAEEISIGKVSGGSRTTFETEFASIPANEWIEGIIEWQSGGDIRFTLRDAGGNTLAQTPLANDTEFSNETGLGWLGNVDGFSGDAVYFDLAQITALSGSPGVTTLSPTNVGFSEATFEGDLDSLGSDSSADVWFEWREVGGSLTSTSKVTKSSTGLFDHTESSLSSETDYEYRAIAENSVGKTEGAFVQFTTDSPTVVDDFEDGDMAEYTRQDSNGSDVTADPQTSTVYAGTYALETASVNNIGGTMTTGSSPGEGLPYYPQAGDTIEYRCRFDSSPRNLQVTFGDTKDNNTGYNTSVTHTSNSIGLQVDGSSLASASVTIPENEWLRAVFDWGSGGSLSFSLYDSAGNLLAEITANDSTYSSGSVTLTGWTSGSENAQAWLDEIVLV